MHFLKVDGDTKEIRLTTGRLPMQKVRIVGRYVPLLMYEVVICDAGDTAYWCRLEKIEGDPYLREWRSDRVSPVGTPAPGLLRRALQILRAGDG